MLFGGGVGLSVDESDVDHPQIDIKDLEPNVSYVIVDYEGTFFPGIVQEIKNKNLKVSCMVPIPSKMLKSLWKWPEKPDNCWYGIDKVVKIISTPILIGNRGKYMVEEAEKFW